MNIRKATIKDINEIISLLREVNFIHYKKRPDIFKRNEKYNKDELEKIIISDKTDIYILDNDKVIGYSIVIYKSLEDALYLKRKILYIDDFCIATEYRKKGYGKMLFEYLMNVAISEKCDSINLNVYEFNSDAKIFYKKLGMKRLKSEMEFILEK